MELTPDEIEWLLYELLPHAQRRYQEIGLEPVAVEVVYTRRQWERELMNAGWRPF